MAGLHLDPWQQTAFRHMLGESAQWKCPECPTAWDGLGTCSDHPAAQPIHPWACFEVGVCVPRQNGKGSLLVARELVGLFLLGERLIIHSAHQQDTSLEGLRRLEGYIRNTPELHELVKAYRHANGTEGIELHDGARISFRTRTSGGGRGFTGDLIIFDEAMFIPQETIGALIPTLSARPNPQIVYAGSAVDQMTHRDGLVFADVRERALVGEDPSLAYFEWSADLELEGATRSAAAEPEHWIQANPGLGYRISLDYIEKEFRSPMSVRTFAVERLGVGDWPKTDGSADKPIDPEGWVACRSDETGTITAYALDVSPDRAFACIGGSGPLSENWGVWPVVRDRGTGWVVNYLTELAPDVLVCDASGPVASLVPDLERAGINVLTVSTKEYTQACGLFYDAVEQRTLRHTGSVELDNAVDGAAVRPVGDSWAWARKTSTADICTLVACTLALWAAQTQVGAVGEGVWSLTEIAERMWREGRGPKPPWL